jgi:hypothetical protein
VTSPQRVSVGQAAANALTTWIQAQVSSDISCFPHWPEPSQLPPKAISVVPAGKRRRLDVTTNPIVDSRVNVDPNTAQVEFRVGSYIQPVQLDVWTTDQSDRDDIIDQLDEALTAGMALTLGGAVTDDPVRDGVLLPLLASDGYSGNVDCWLDEPEVDDSPDAILRQEYRATYLGEVRGAFSVVRTVGRLVRPHLSILGYDTGKPYPGQLATLITIQAQPPGTPSTVSYGTSGQTMIRFPIGTAASQFSVSLIPANAIIIDAVVQIVTPYDVGTTISLGQTGAVALFMPTSGNIPQAANLYDFDQNTPSLSTSLPLLATIVGSPAAGSGFVSIIYMLANA